MAGFGKTLAKLTVKRTTFYHEELGDMPLRQAWLGLILCVPWLSPYTAGPSPNMWPWLISAACVVVLCIQLRGLTVEVVAVSWVIAAGCSAVIGLIQYSGLSPNLAPWISPAETAQAFGNLRQRNHFATLTAIGFASAIFLIAKRSQITQLFWGTFLVVALLAAAAAASGSRTGLLQWLFVAALSSWAHKKESRILTFIAAAIFAYFLWIALLPYLVVSFTGLHASALLHRFLETSGCESRAVLWGNVWTLILQKPWLGWGWGELDYAHFITLYREPRFCQILDNAHNLALHLAVELGLPAATAICVGAIWLAWRQNPWELACGSRLLAWAVLGALGIHSMLEYPLWYGPFQIALGLCCWVLWIRPGKEEWAGGRFFFPLANAVVAWMALTGLLGAGFWYWRVSQIYLAPEARHESYRDDTLNKLRGTPVFHNQFRFAELALTPLRRDNAAAIFESSRDLLHYSPEPKVIEKLLDSAALIGREDDLVFYGARYRAAFPVDYARWAARQSIPPK